MRSKVNEHVASWTSQFKPQFEVLLTFLWGKKLRAQRHPCQWKVETVSVDFNCSARRRTALEHHKVFDPQRVIFIEPNIFFQIFWFAKFLMQGAGTISTDNGPHERSTQDFSLRPWLALAMHVSSKKSAFWKILKNFKPISNTLFWGWSTMFQLNLCCLHHCFGVLLCCCKHLAGITPEPLSSSDLSRTNPCCSPSHFIASFWQPPASQPCSSSCLLVA